MKILMPFELVYLSYLCREVFSLFLGTKSYAIDDEVSGLSPLKLWKVEIKS